MQKYEGKRIYSNILKLLTCSLYGSGACCMAGKTNAVVYYVLGLL